MVLLVERPTKEECLRVIGNRTRPDGVLAPKTEVERVGIGTRVRVVFTDVARGLAVPNGPLMRVTPAARRGDTGVRGRSPVRERRSVTIILKAIERSCGKSWEYQT